METVKLFKCADCHARKPKRRNGGTGYATIGKRKICYTCCGIRDSKRMTKEGAAVLYLSKTAGRYNVTNWPGSLKFAAQVQKGRHNIARTRYDSWFTGPDGYIWHGVTYGDFTQICHCKRTKERAA